MANAQQSGPQWKRPLGTPQTLYGHGRCAGSTECNTGWSSARAWRCQASDARFKTNLGIRMRELGYSSYQDYYRRWFAAVAVATVNGPIW